jgi:hypothetical protein
VNAPTGARMTNEPELFGAAEAAEALGINTTNLRAIVGLPKPYDKIRASPLYRADEIRELAARRNARLAAEAARRAARDAEPTAA